jgi:hypothetical protein
VPHNFRLPCTPAATKQGLDFENYWFTTVAGQHRPPGIRARELSNSLNIARIRSTSPSATLTHNATAQIFVLQVTMSR